MTSKDRAVHSGRIEGTVMAANSYVIEAPDGLVIIEGQLTIADARAVRRRITGGDAFLILFHPAGEAVA